MPPTPDWHVGRSWTGTTLEDTCPCPKEQCGLVDISKAMAECGEHSVTMAKTMRQGHPAELCLQLFPPLPPPEEP